MYENIENISLFKKIKKEEQIKFFSKWKEIWLNPGETLFRQGDTAKYFYLVISGKIEISHKSENYEIIVNICGPETVFGEVSLLADISQPVSGKSICYSHLYYLNKDDFWQMLVDYPSVREVIFSFMATRIQELLTLSQNHKKLISLGTLAAGLAHEINNPLSAARSATEKLQDTLQERHSTALKYFQFYLEPTQLEYLFKIKNDAIKNATQSGYFDPVIEIDLEDKLIDWMSKNGVINGWKFAHTLIAGGITIDTLELFRKQLNSNVFKNLIVWLDKIISETSLLRIIEHSTMRISDLIKNVKAYSYMDQTLVKRENVDIHEGIESTIAILEHKFQQNDIVLIRNYAQNLPEIYADGSALNQVWTNLLDNSIHSLSDEGKIWVSTSLKNNHVMVKITDNGVGIPQEYMSRIFEPFFTTREIGEGSGIGLYLTHRIIVGAHNGSIDCISKPGKTSFIVHLPLSPL